MDTVSLTIPGAKQSVELENPHGIFYKIRVDGDVIKRQRGSWYIPLRGGKEARLKARGLIPGFQVLKVDGDTIYDMGTGVSRLERIVMFAPILLVLLGPVRPRARPGAVPHRHSRGEEPADAAPPAHRAADHQLRRRRAHSHAHHRGTSARGR